jgi:diguanylate cyclase (GGDEF)-like protein
VRRPPVSSALKAPGSPDGAGETALPGLDEGAPLARYRVRLRVVQGALLALGAPGGWLLMRLAQGNPLRQEVADQPGLYLYMLLATLGVFTVFGRMLGRSEERLATHGRHFEALSLTDPLTGLHNRRYFDQRLHEEWAGAQRKRTELCLVMIDLDRFKAVNDELGHPTGDRVLEAVGRALSGCARAGETFARVGGEEFAALLPATGAEQGKVAAERFRRAIREQVEQLEPFRAGRVLGVSAGVASLRGGDRWRGADLLAAADCALYRAKSLGRDRVTVADPPERRNSA